MVRGCSTVRASWGPCRARCGAPPTTGSGTLAASASCARVASTARRRRALRPSACRMGCGTTPSPRWPPAGSARIPPCGASPRPWPRCPAGARRRGTRPWPACSSTPTISMGRASSTARRSWSRCRAACGRPSTAGCGSDGRPGCAWCTASRTPSSPTTAWSSRWTQASAAPWTFGCRRVASGRPWTPRRRGLRMRAEGGSGAMAARSRRLLRRARLRPRLGQRARLATRRWPPQFARSRRPPRARGGTGLSAPSCWTPTTPTAAARSTPPRSPAPPASCGRPSTTACARPTTTGCGRSTGCSRTVPTSDTSWGSTRRGAPRSTSTCACAGASVRATPTARAARTRCPWRPPQTAVPRPRAARTTARETFPVTTMTPAAAWRPMSSGMCRARRGARWRRPPRRSPSASTRGPAARRARRRRGVVSAAFCRCPIWQKETRRPRSSAGCRRAARPRGTGT
jgi:hypothetical protein